MERVEVNEIENEGLPNEYEVLYSGRLINRKYTAIRVNDHYVLETQICSDDPIQVHWVFDVVHEIPEAEERMHKQVKRDIEKLGSKKAELIDNTRFADS